MTARLQSLPAGGFDKDVFDIQLKRAALTAEMAGPTGFELHAYWSGPDPVILRFEGRDLVYGDTGRPVDGTLTRLTQLSTDGRILHDLSGFARDVADLAGYFDGSRDEDLLTALVDPADLVLSSLGERLVVTSADFGSDPWSEQVLGGVVGSAGDDWVSLALDPARTTVVSGGGGYDRFTIVVDAALPTRTDWSLDTGSGTIAGLSVDGIEELTLSSRGAGMDVTVTSGGAAMQGDFTFTVAAGDQGRIQLEGRSDDLHLAFGGSSFVAMALADMDDPFAVDRITGTIRGTAHVTLGAGDDAIVWDPLVSSLAPDVFEAAVVEGGAGQDRLSIAHADYRRIDLHVDGATGRISQPAGVGTVPELSIAGVEEIVLAAGDDTVLDAQAYARIDTALGDDTVVLRAGAAHTTVTLGAGTDRIVFEGGQATITDFQVWRDRLDLDAITARVGPAEVTYAAEGAWMRWQEGVQTHELMLEGFTVEDALARESGLIALFAGDSTDGTLRVAADVAAVFGDAGEDRVVFDGTPIAHPVVVTLGEGGDRITYAGGADVVLTDFVPGVDELDLRSFAPERSRPDIFETDAGLSIVYGDADAGAGESLTFAGLGLADMHMVLMGVEGTRTNVSKGQVGAVATTWIEHHFANYDPAYDSAAIWVSAVLHFPPPADPWSGIPDPVERTVYLDSGRLAYAGQFGMVIYEGRDFAGTVDAQGVVTMTAGTADSITYIVADRHSTEAKVLIDPDVIWDLPVRDTRILQTTTGLLIDMADLSAAIALARQGDVSGLAALPVVPQRFDGWYTDDIGYGDNGADWLDGRGGADVLYPFGGDDMVIGGMGTDRVMAVSGHTGVVADLAAGRLRDGWGGTDTLDGIEDVTSGGFDDDLRGSQQDNHLSAGAGDDILIGRAGDDTLEGGAGADWFVFGTGTDVIVDFEPGLDRVVIAPNPASRGLRRLEDGSDGRQRYDLDGDVLEILSPDEGWVLGGDDLLFVSDAEQAREQAIDRPASRNIVLDLPPPAFSATADWDDLPG